ncbi:Oxysterol-binding protein-related protein 10 [Anabarilius grahami]|uniref:Oxysterol-binding protein n=1 Tax=Anabarilius grahami TaxID=495550 RepID=A0A3N0Z114_ANAGA|nr:Oxysterol-binding protein-related protein 10 [Anabarilius grahami]
MGWCYDKKWASLGQGRGSDRGDCEWVCLGQGCGCEWGGTCRSKRGKRQSENVPVWAVPKSPSEECLRNSGASTLSSTEPSPSLRNKNLLQHTEQDRMEVISPDEEVMDSDDNSEEDLGVLEDQRSVILHLLSQLKLGMDLTRVVLPTFILEKRSLLEMYANFMAHPDLFLSISAGNTPEERMVRFVEYYMTAFHEGRKGAIAKKPYNPVLGETFCCSWAVPRERVHPLRVGPRDVTNQEAAGAESDYYRVRFVAEQVSHHPPVSGFYCECAERGMCVNAHIWTKSKFMGMSVGVSMVGEGVLHLRDHGEEYVFTFPSAFARSIITVPWVELGGKVTISCAQTGYSASVTFHTKPFYAGKVHRVSAEVKQNSSGTVVCKAQGEWNGTLEFTYSSGETKVIDTNKLPVIKKMIRPVEKQGRSESRRLWQHVTAALKEENIDLATEHKHQLEEDQRSGERQRATNNMPWKPKYFNKEGDGWVYRNPLWKNTLR